MTHSVLQKHPGRFPDRPRLFTRLERLLEYQSLEQAIRQFWLASANRRAETWTEHRDINAVMLATCLAPEGYIAI
jgi:hypothetical protein